MIDTTNKSTIDKKIRLIKVQSTIDKFLFR